MVLEGRLELPRIAPLAPQASASAIPPPEHGLERLSLSDISNIHHFYELSSGKYIFFRFFLFFSKIIFRKY